MSRLWLCSLPLQIDIGTHNRPTLNRTLFHSFCLGFLFATTSVFPVGFNETPKRLATWRMRSGVRFMMRAASSNDFDAFASSITRRSSAYDQDLRISRSLLSRQRIIYSDGVAADLGKKYPALR